MSPRLACSLFALFGVVACGDDGGTAKIDSGVIDGTRPRRRRFRL
jgi:hypothetical protein